MNNADGNKVLTPRSQVFYSSSAQIAKLIENMSKNMDAGSFNIMPNTPTRAHMGASPTSYHSVSTEGEQWTIEGLDRVIGRRNGS